jgi:hypothetical protein
MRPRTPSASRPVVPDSLKHRLPDVPPSRKRFLWPGLGVVVVLAGVAAIVLKVLVWSSGPASAACAQMEGKDELEKAVVLQDALGALKPGEEVEAFVADLFARCWAVMPLPENSPYLAPLAAEAPSIAIHAGSGVEAADRGTALEWAVNAEGIIARYAGGHVPSLTVFADIDPAALARQLAEVEAIPFDEAYEHVSRGYSGGPGAVFLNLTSMPLVRPDGYFEIAHEVAHAYQAYLASPALNNGVFCPAYWTRRTGPRWLDEGTAELVGRHAFVDSPYWPGTQTAEAYHRSLLEAAYRDFDGSLRLLATDNGWNTYGADSAAYAFSYAAVSLLEDEAGRTALFDYWRNLGRGQCWEAAFSDAFGFTPDRFYDLFEDWRT